MNNRQLYDNHISDLKRVCPQAGDVFVCPICFQVFSESEALNRENVNLGHVWPEKLRNKSEIAKHQQVLVCKKCNSLAGSQGDKEMQEHEENRQNESNGEEYLVRGYFQREKEDIFRGLKDWLTMRLVYDPVKGVPIIRQKIAYFEHNKDFLYLANQGCDVLYILDYYDWNLAQIGWLTSAYLFAFYTFGYRFIFHKSLDIVRQVIRDSFQGKTNISLQDTGDNSMLSVRTCDTHYIENPNLGYKIPIEGLNQTHFIEISFLDYHVRMPGREAHLVAVPNASNAPIDFIPQLFISPDSGHRPHQGECEFDALFDVNYEIVGDKLTPRQHY